MPPEDRAVLAGEYVLGLLSGEERTDAERRLLADPAFAADALLWEKRLEGLYDVVPPAAVADHVWDRILPRLAANDAEPVAASASSSGWRYATAGFAALAAALAGVLVLRPQPVPVTPAPVIVQAPAETLVAQLNDGAGASILAVRADQRAGVLRVRTTAVPAGAGEPELWVIPAGGSPRSLGLIAREGQTAVRLGGELAALVADGATLALTLERREGAPHAAPTGTILGTARITRI